MELWSTSSGDLWLCSECAKKNAATIYREQWLPVFKSADPTLRCGECSETDVETEE